MVMRQDRHAEASLSATKCAFLLPLAFLVLALGTARAQTNPIVIENQQPGSAAWDLDTSKVGTDTVGQIKGYASAASINKGENITFYVSTNPAQTYTIDVYRVGWYQGLGGRLMQHIGPLNGVTQPTCPMDATTGMIECRWAPAYTLATQTSWTSGIYLCILTNAQGYQNYIIFVVRDDSRIAALLYQSPVATNQAYNDYPDDGKTGKSLYDFNSYGAVLAATGYKSAAKVSFDRPYQDTGIDEGFRSDYGEVNFIRWMEASGYDVSYTTDVDTHANGSILLNYKGILSMGHDEYWSKPMYDAVNAARDAGVNLGFFGADAVSWQIRFESSSTGVPNRVIVCYRDVNLDPITDLTLKTINWRDPVLNRPEQVLMGIQYNDNSSPPQNGQGFFPSYVVTNSGDWVYAGTGLTDGTAVKGLVGYEADRYDNTYPSPNAVSGTYFLLSHSPWGTGQYQYSNSSVYQAPSGAWVFSTGTMNWNWALDLYGHGYNLVDPRIQQTTANILNRFVSSSGAQTLPTVISVTPVSGTTTGGTAITISGTNFVAGATVSLGSSAATSVSVVNSTTITATTPAGSARSVNVTVTNPNGQSGTLSNAFTYSLPAPMVTGVTPVSGSTIGGTPITISGTNFVAGATVSLGSSAATVVTFVNSTTITATTPAGAAGSVNVTVTNPDGQSGTLSNAFAYSATAPTVGSVSPNTGFTTGGTAVTITGTNFAAGAAVSLGGGPATGVNVLNGTTITATTPAHAAGPVNIVVTNTDGQSGTLTAGFTYVLPAPTVASVTPISGSTTGGTSITISGTNFVAGATVSLGSSAATGVAVVNGTTITATTPAGAAGTVNMTVTNPDGQSGTLSNAFTYNLTAPTVSNVSPSTGLTAGGTAITITGTNFAAGAAVSLGGSPATGVTVVNGTTIAATTPAHAAGAVNITVTNTDGQNGTLTAGFSYLLPAPTVSNASPNVGLTTGGTAITISGANFVAGATVTVGGSPATGVAVLSGTTIAATTPAHAAGAVNITVTNTDGQSGTLTSGFTYVLPAPTVSNVSPNTGLTTGGTAITISGANFVAGVTVTVGGSPATGVAVLSGTTIAATTPAHAAGAVNITVTNTDGQSGTLTSGFTYVLPAPTVGNVSPNTGLTTGGTAITITGTNFVAGATATVGGSPAAGVAVITSTTITATTPAHAVGAVGVTVTNPDTQSGTLATGFTYTAVGAPTLVSITPNSGLRGTAVPVTLTGTNFAATGTSIAVSGTGVTVGTLTVVNSSTITATFTIAASATISTRNVSVTTSGGTSNTHTFAVQGPLLTSISPSTGERGTNVPVTLTGSGLTGVNAITVSGGGVTVSNLTVVDDATVTATFEVTAGAGLSARSVKVVTPVSGTSNAVTFTVVLPPVPTLVSIAPNSGVRGTAVPVTLTGTNFTAMGTKIVVSGSGVTVSNLTVVNDTAVTATFTIAVSAATTARNVTVTTPGGTSNIQTFTVLGPTLSSVTPNPVTHGAGILLTLTGTNLAGATAVTVSGTGNSCTVSASTSTTVNTTCTLTAGADTVKVTTPIGATGTIPLTVN
jgi:hypothetical protein